MSDILLEVGKTYNRRKETKVNIIDKVEMRNLEIDVANGWTYEHLPYDDTLVYIAYCTINQKLFPYFENGRMLSYVDMNKGRWNTDIISDNTIKQMRETLKND